MVKEIECAKCKNNFKAQKKINGEKKNLYGRKYCLECSPYKKGNTTTLEINEDEEAISYLKGVVDSDGSLFKSDKS